MDVYYRKSMGNGTIASKFRLNKALDQDSTAASVERHLDDIPKDTETSKKMNFNSVEMPSTHHQNNCVRCYRLKKKCSRSYPTCSNCLKSGSSCEYVERTNKRHKRLERKRIDSPKEDSPFLQVDDRSTKISYPSKERDATSQVSISSMLAKEEADNEATQRKPLQNLGSAGIDVSILKNITKSTLNIPETNNTLDDFITMKPFGDTDLPTVFINNFFQNFESKYPFIDKNAFIEDFRKIDFANETIIRLEVYLTMCIGCLIYETGKKVSVFQDFFSERVIKSIFDVVNYNFDSLDDHASEHVKLLLLLTIYSMSISNENLCWELVGILTRLVIKLDMYKVPSSILNERIFWSIYILEKEMSLLMSKPSQLPDDDLISLQFPLVKSFGKHEDLQRVDDALALGKLHNKLLNFSLRASKLNSVEKCETLNDLSREIEKWRVSSSSHVHQSLSQSPLLKDEITMLNISYFYFLIELDQFSSTESFQFTLQFLSNSFSLILSDNSKIKLEFNLNSYFWHKKLINVISYNLFSINYMLDPQSNIIESDLKLKLDECNSNLSLLVNMMGYLSFKVDTFKERCKLIQKDLSGFNQKLLVFDRTSGTDSISKAELSREIIALQKKLAIFFK